MSGQLSRAELLKQKRAFWKQHIDNWQASGMTQRAYCHEHDLKDYRFSYWKKRFVQNRTEVTFVPVKIQQPMASAPVMNSQSLQLSVGSDFQIEIKPDFDPGLLQRLIVTLRSLP